MNYSEQNSEPKSAKITFVFFLPCKHILIYARLLSLNLTDRKMYKLVEAFSKQTLLIYNHVDSKMTKKFIN